jgi:hypothetical protein
MIYFFLPYRKTEQSGITDPNFGPGVSNERSGDHFRPVFKPSEKQKELN